MNKVTHVGRHGMVDLARRANGGTRGLSQNQGFAEKGQEKGDTNASAALKNAYEMEKPDLQMLGLGSGYGLLPFGAQW